MATIEEARSQIESKRQEAAVAYRGIQARQAALPETRTQQALRVLGGIAGVPTKKRVAAERMRLAGQEQEIRKYEEDIGAFERQVSESEQAKATYLEKQAAYKKAKRLYRRGSDISAASGMRYVKGYLKEMKKVGALMGDVQEKAMAKELEGEGFKAVYDGKKLVGFEDPYAQMSVGLHELPKHLERYDVPKEDIQLAYKDTFTGEMTSMAPELATSRQAPVAVSGEGRVMGVAEHIRLQAEMPEAFKRLPKRDIPSWEIQAAPKKTIMERIKDIPTKGVAMMTGRVVAETGPEVREPVTMRDAGGRVIETAVAAREALYKGGEYIAEKIPYEGKGIKITKARVVPAKPAGYYDVPEFVPEFGTRTDIVDTGARRMEWKEKRRKEVYAPTYIFGAERVKEAVGFGLPLGVEIAATTLVPAKVVVPLIAGAGAITTVEATKEIKELEKQKIDVSKIQKEIGVKPASVLPSDWEKYKSEYAAEIERYNKEIDAAIKAQKTSRMIGVAGVGLGAVVGGVVAKRAASRFLKTKIVREIPLPLAKPETIVVQKVVDIKGKPKTISVLERRGEVSPWVVKTTTTKGREIKDFFGKHLEKIVRVGEKKKPMVSMRAPPKVELIPHRPFITRTTAPAVEGEMFTTVTAVAGRKQLKVSKLFDTSKKTKMGDEIFLRGPTGEKLAAEKVKDIEQFLVSKLSGKKDTIKLIKDEDSLRTSFGFAQDVSKIRATPRTFTEKPIKSPVEVTLGVSEVRDVIRLPKMDIFDIKTMAKRIKTAKPRRAGKIQEFDTTLIRLKDELPADVGRIGRAELGPAAGSGEAAKKLVLKEAEELASIAELVPLPTSTIPKPTIKTITPELVKTKMDVTTKIMAPQIISYDKLSIDDRAPTPIRKKLVKAREIDLVGVALKAPTTIRAKVAPTMFRKEPRYKMKAKYAFGPLDISAVRDITKPAVREAVKSADRKAIKPAAITTTKTISPILTLPTFMKLERPKPGEPQPPKPPKPIKPIILLKKRKVKKPIPVITRVSKPKIGYEVEVKRAGEWVDVTPFALSEGEALALGRRETKAGAEVSFRLKEADGIGGTLNLAPITRAELRDEYRGKIVKGKEVKDPQTFIQKRKARIATKGEFLAITAKGIEKRKAKKGDIKWI